MKKIFIAKSGLEFRFLQCVIIFPINLIISHILQTVFNEQIIVFISSFIIINILWIIRNSFVIFENGKIKFRIIGIPQTVDCSNATELRLIDSKELSKTYRSITAQNPVQTNFFNLLLPINHTITFKNQNYSTVLISVYKSDELLFLIEEFIEDDQNAEPQQNKDAENTQSVAPRQSYTGSRTEKYFIKMPFGSHIKCYLKSFVVTIISPAVLSAVLSFTFSMRFDALDFNTMFIILFVILSV
ncbi:MAG: hypothetical protein K2G56_04790, partial [Eubacterium sp.]|nr:hypothetical protein [Eubacterium sp.]